MKESKGNHLVVRCPNAVPTYLEVFLNGRQVNSLIAFRAEVPEGDGTPLMRVTLTFYSALELDAVLQETERTAANAVNLLAT